MYGDCSINAEVGTISHTLLTIFFWNGSSINISHPEIDYFQNCTNDVIVSSNKWFKVNKLALNFDKTNVMKFCTNSKTCISLDIVNIKTIKFLGLQTDSNSYIKKLLNILSLN